MKNLVASFISHRETARVNHDMGMKPPFCSDKIINTYRFCNVQREDDKVTRWLKKHWRDPYWQHPNFIPAMILARMVNWPPTLGEIGFPEVWDAKKVAFIIKAQTGKTWSAAYMITTCGKKMDKADYVVETAARAMQVKPPFTTLRGLYQQLIKLDGLGAGFLAAQVVADVKYTPLLLKAEDWWTFAVPGPGSRRGINRYFGLPLEAKLPDKVWYDKLGTVAGEVGPLIDIELHAQDWQNIMCEFDKYMRVKLGEGRPRARYQPQTDYTI